MAVSFEKLSPTKFPKAITTALCAVAIILFVSSFLMPFLVDLPDVQLWLLKGMKVAAGVLLVLILLHIFPLIQHIKNVKNGAPLFPVAQTKHRYRPWPAHSHPVARKTRWGPVEQEYEVYGKKTRLLVNSKNIASQKPKRLRVGFIVFLLVAGVSLLLFPIIAGSLVYEITPPEIEALQTFATEFRILFWLVSIVFIGAALLYFCSPVRLAVFDKSGSSYITVSRFLGLLDRFLTPQRVTFKATDVAGLQIAYHRSKSLKQNDRYIDQYELIVVLSDGVRHLLTKGSRQSAILVDAVDLAKFLGVNVWDRSTHYHPDLPSIVSPIDPVIQPL